MADLTDQYLASMEEVLEVYERPHNPSEPVVCLDEKPVTLHADVRTARPMTPGKVAGRITSTSDAVPPICSVPSSR